MFGFVIRYLGFLKIIPGLAHVFDAWLRLWSMITKPALRRQIDEIETEVSRWEHITTHIHKYGGLQFNYQQAELGHIHSNGLLDMLLSRKLKAQLMTDGRIKDHHSFKNTGWISFYIRTNDDKQYAVDLLRMAFEMKKRHY